MFYKIIAFSDILAILVCGGVRMNEMLIIHYSTSFIFYQSSLSIVMELRETSLCASYKEDSTKLVPASLHPMLLICSEFCFFATSDSFCFCFDFLICSPAGLKL